jgi:hypothetical protein
VPTTIAPAPSPNRGVTFWSIGSTMVEFTLCGDDETVAEVSREIQYCAAVTSA